MKKNILCLAMTAILVLGMPMTANAEHFTGSLDWKVSFSGDKLESNFKSSDAATEVLENLQPGDSMELQVKIENNSGTKSDWYMTNEVVETLEDSSNSAEGGAYTYILTYKAPDGTETVIYSSQTVGGENILKTDAEEGLHQATSTLEDHFFLDRLEKGETAVVQLHVGLDGETQGNAYQDTLAKLQMNFAVEKVQTRTPNVVKRSSVVTVERVQTGDTAPVILFSAAALVSAVVLLVIVSKQMKERQKKGEQS